MIFKTYWENGLFFNYLLFIFGVQGVDIRWSEFSCFSRIFYLYFIQNFFQGNKKSTNFIVLKEFIMQFQRTPQLKSSRADLQQYPQYLKMTSKSCLLRLGFTRVSLKIGHATFFKMRIMWLQQIYDVKRKNVHWKSLEFN